MLSYLILLLIRKKIFSFTGLFVLLLSLHSRSQQIEPITAAVQLVPPYSVYLPDYAAPGSDKLRVILTLNDPSQPAYRVKLRLKVELNGRPVLQTDPAYQPLPLDLVPGQPVIISGAQLSDYLRTDHLQFVNGFSREQYERTKALPEGVYRICFTAYDYTRSDKPLSNEGCNLFFFKKNEPPLLNLPLHRSRVDRKEPQFVTFSWSSRNTPSLPTTTGGTGYRFELFEVHPRGANAEYIVRSSKPIYSATTEATTLVYGPAEPLLQDSMEYVWRVQAYDREGRDAYQNNGFSSASVFTYGGEDPFQVHRIGWPTLTGEALSERSGRWSWHSSNGHKVEGWQIQYRKQAATSFEWNTKETTDTLLNLFNLEADHPYEARVQARVGGLYGPFSEVVVFRTLPQRVFECGQEYAVTPIEEGQPLQTATPGMLVQVGQFQMQLLQVEGSNGYFSGYGAIGTKLLGFRLHVKFSGVRINDKLQLTQGQVEAISEPLGDWIKERLEVQQDVQVIKRWKEKLPDFDTASLETLQDFARELLSIEAAIIQDTYVYSEAERQAVQGYIAEVKAAMADLVDSDSTNNGAAETKLRQTLKAASPLLQKISNNIGKGVRVQLGLIREKLYKAVVADYIKELKANTGTGFKPFTNANYLVNRGPNNEEEEIGAKLPDCLVALDKNKQEAIADYLQQKISYTADWKRYAEALQEGIAQQPADETFFAAREKEIEEASSQAQGLAIEDWADQNAIKWTAARERLCQYIVDEFEAARNKEANLNSLVQEGVTDLYQLNGDEIHTFRYGVKIRFKKEATYQAGKVTIEGKTYVPLYSPSTYAFTGFYDQRLLPTVAKEPGKDYYLTARLDEKAGWLDKEAYEIVSQFQHSYVRAFFHSSITQQLDEQKALQIASWLDQINPDVYDQYLQLAWKDRTEQEKALYDIGLHSGLSWQGFEAALKDFITALKGRQQALLNACQRWVADGKKADLREFIIKQILWRFEEADYLNLSIIQRTSVLQLLLEGNLHGWNLGDQIALKLAIRVPEDQQKSWLEWLVGNKQLKPLFGKVDGEEFSELITALSGFVLKHYPRPVSFTPEEAALNGRFVLFKQGLFTGYALNQWVTNEGYLGLYSRPQFTLNPRAAYTITATDWVYVDFKSPFAFNEQLRFAKGTRLPLPALLAYALFNEENNRRLLQGGKLALDVALLFTGLGELNAAMKAGSALEKAVRVSKAIADLGVALGDITINNVLADKLGESEEGRAFLSTWNILSLYYGIASVSTEVGLYAKKLYQQKKVLQQLEGTRALSQEVKEELDKITQEIEVKTGVVDEVEVVGKYDWGLVRMYFNHIQEVTGRAVLQKQVDKLKDALKVKEYTRLSDADYINHTKMFTTSKKNELIAKWEIETGQNWPTYTENIYSKSGSILRKAGDKYDAHHIIEQQFGGEHEWWNMHPAKFPDEHQGGIHGAGSPARELFK